MLDWFTTNICLISSNLYLVFLSFWEQWLCGFTSLDFFVISYRVCVSCELYTFYTRTIYVVPMERAWKDNSNHNKYLKKRKISTWRVVLQIRGQHVIDKACLYDVWQLTYCRTCKRHILHKYRSFFFQISMCQFTLNLALRLIEHCVKLFLFFHS